LEQAFLYRKPREYRFTFNGKENDNEVSGTGNQYDYGFRIYNPRLARFLSIDPLSGSFPWYTPYQFAGNNPIWAIDLDGLEDEIIVDDLGTNSVPLLDFSNEKTLNIWIEIGIKADLAEKLSEESGIESKYFLKVFNVTVAENDQVYIGVLDAPITQKDNGLPFVDRLKNEAKDIIIDEVTDEVIDFGIEQLPVKFRKLGKFSRGIIGVLFDTDNPLGRGSDFNEYNKVVEGVTRYNGQAMAIEHLKNLQDYEMVSKVVENQLDNKKSIQMKLEKERLNDVQEQSVDSGAQSQEQSRGFKNNTNEFVD